MKKLTAIFSVIISLIMVLSFTACNSGGTTPPPGEPTEVSTLHIAANSVELFVGETFDLNVTKKDGEGEEQTIEQITYSSDSTLIATVSNGIITAKAVGSTYINVTADGLEKACFVTVKEGVRGETFEVRVADDSLYATVPVQAYVYVKVDGVLIGTVENVTFTTEQTDVLSIDADGVITPLTEAESVTIKAEFTYNGKNYEEQTTLSVVPPYRYSVSRARVTLASTKTYSGADNTAYTSTGVQVMRKNAITGEEVVIPGEQLTVTTQSPLFTSEIIGDSIKLSTADGQVGSTSVYVAIEGVSDPCYFTLTVAHAISTIQDMDKLSLAAVNTPEDLSSSFVMINDIDYDGKAIYPIANYMDSSTRVGYQWKYAVQKDQNNAYVAVDRANIGQDGYGLTDKEYVLFAQSKGVSNGNKSFSGTFDGNGYSIKNAALMYASNMGRNTDGFYLAKYMAVFGTVTNGTIKNLDISLSVQKPSDFEEDYGVALNKIYDGSISQTSAIDCTNYLTASSLPYYSGGAALVSRSSNCTVENVRFSIDYTSSALSGTNLSAIVSEGVSGSTDKLNVINCVIDVNHDIRTNVKYAISKSLTAGKIQNCLIIGTNGVTTTINANKEDKGTNGVYYGDMKWTKSGDTYTKTLRTWAELYATSIGIQATNALSMSDVIATFKTSLWDTSGYTATNKTALSLIKGCSIPAAPVAPEAPKNPAQPAE